MNIIPKKSLGQNFLLDKNIIKKVCDNGKCPIQIDIRNIECDIIEIYKPKSVEGFTPQVVDMKTGKVIERFEEEEATAAEILQANAADEALIEEPNVEEVSTSEEPSESVQSNEEENPSEPIDLGPEPPVSDDGQASLF